MSGTVLARLALHSDLLRAVSLEAIENCHERTPSMPNERLDLQEFCRSDQELMQKATKRAFTHFKIRHEPGGLSLVALLSGGEAGHALRASEAIVAASDIVGLLPMRRRRATSEAVDVASR